MVPNSKLQMATPMNLATAWMRRDKALLTGGGGVDRDFEAALRLVPFFGGIVGSLLALVTVETGSVNSCDRGGLKCNSEGGGGPFLAWFWVVVCCC
jgi:hypothetical protein